MVFCRRPRFWRKIIVQKRIKPTANSRFSQLRILLWIHVHVSQEFLSLSENIKFRTSQLTRSGGTSGCEITTISLLNLRIFLILSFKQSLLRSLFFQAANLVCPKMKADILFRQSVFSQSKIFALQGEFQVLSLAISSGTPRILMLRLMLQTNIIKLCSPFTFSKPIKSV